MYESTGDDGFVVEGVEMRWNLMDEINPRTRPERGFGLGSRNIENYWSWTHGCDDMNIRNLTLAIRGSFISDAQTF